MEDITVEPVAREVDLRLDRARLTEVEHAGDGRDRVQVDVLPDRGAEGTGVVLHQRRAGQIGRTELIGQALGHPEPEMDLATARIGSGLDAADQQACSGGGEKHATGR